ncbi:protein asteroid homolog 1 [Exaiptasia diaphana]|uniref:Asteroid domain-containing protein n=1 Tax=Exaiptasia diaphana TaxID=2652724 RepID=A0A913X4Q5_EXADI|nr:protein asteroid homolog 1 [Exaiptasia diaphana]KXJ27112.1 Protein asteroid-like 1 [Exaiptasia diaphana]
MGVRGLTSFVNNIPSVWSTEGDLRDTRVIIDGWCLIFYLHGSIDSRYGGQYDRFSNKIQHFFDCFRKKNVETYVVLDGPTVAVDKKLNTVIRRASDTVKRCYKISKGDSSDGLVVPPLAKKVFVEKLRQMRIPFAVCDREADQEIASLAHQWNCPAISNDSDFFIYDLPEGYIPLSHLHYNEYLLHVRVYHHEKLCDYLEIHQRLLPLLASLLGNDFVDQQVLAPFKCALEPIQPSSGTYIKQEVKRICRFLADSSNIGEALESVLDTVDEESEKTSLEKALTESLAEYAISDGTLASYFELGHIHTNLSDVPKYVIDRHREGDFPSRYFGVISCARHILKFQIEDVKQKTANRCSKKLRQIIYGILFKPGENGNEVMEWDRTGTVAQNQRVKPDHRPVKGFGDLPDLESIEHMDDEQRRKLLSSIFKMKVKSVTSLPESKQLFIMSIRYWISHARPKVNKRQVQTLILQHLQPRNFEEMPSFDISLQHNLAQWQSVMTETIFLNEILLDAFPEPDLSTLYNGATSQAIMHEHSHERALDQFVSELDEFQMLYNAATDRLEDKLQRGETSLAEGDVIPKRKDKSQTSHKQVSKSGSNPFDVLQDLSDDD